MILCVICIFFISAKIVTPTMVEDAVGCVAAGDPRVAAVHQDPGVAAVHQDPGVAAVHQGPEVAAVQQGPGVAAVHQGPRVAAVHQGPRARAQGRPITPEERQERERAKHKR